MDVVYELAEENLKTFVAAIHCLAQIGKELSIEAGALGQLTCRALNDEHSASGQIAFERSFFAAVHVQQEGNSHSQRTTTPFVRCKVFAKSCCNIFRTLKHVRSLQIAFLVTPAAPTQSDDGLPTQDDDEDVDCEEIRWRLRCDFDITKTHRMKVHAGQIMRAVFDRSSCPSHVVARQFHLASLLAHIHHSNEVAVTCAETQVKFESYFPATGDGKAHLHTETAVDSAEFQEYVLAPSSIGIDASVQLIFCIKEVRALLAFCKASDIGEVWFYFSTSGRYVCCGH
jgi:cell cycle checkpoint control protein RAD9A